MGRSRYIEDKDGNEAKVTAAIEALKVDIATVDTGILSTIKGVLDAIQTLLEGTQLAKIWDGTHTADINVASELTVNDGQLVAITTALQLIDDLQPAVNTTTVTKIIVGLMGLDGEVWRRMKVNASGELVIALS